MNRRDAVQYISLLLGGTVLGAEAFLTGCKNSNSNSADLTENDLAYLDEIGETILPKTKTPGAKDAHVGQFMAMMVNDTYEEKDQKIFREGMNKIQKLSDKEYDKDFMSISNEQRHALLVKLDKEQADYMKNKKPEDPKHYFRLMKELTLLGFFTSEVGCTQARRYVESPGRYEPCVPYKKGDKAWA